MNKEQISNYMKSSEILKTLRKPRKEIKIRQNVSVLRDLAKYRTGKVVKEVEKVYLGTPGKDGKNYDITKKDKHEIAEMVRRMATNDISNAIEDITKGIDLKAIAKSAASHIIVPVVDKIIERTEVIREIPVINNIISESGESKQEPIDVERLINKDEIANYVFEFIKGLKGNNRLDISNIRNGEQLASMAAKASRASGGFNMNDQRWHGASNNTSSSGYTILQTTGTIDDTNVSFPFISLPKEIVINGSSYIPTGGAYTWTWNPGTLTATLNQPIYSGSSIYGRS